MVPPAYYQDSFVDHELSKNLDSTFAFEGPEKLLKFGFGNQRLISLVAPMVKD